MEGNGHNIEMLCNTVDKEVNLLALDTSEEADNETGPADIPCRQSKLDRIIQSSPCIGSGKFGDVLKVKLPESGCVASKRNKEPVDFQDHGSGLRCNPDPMEQFNKQLDAYKGLRHRNIATFFTAIITTHFYIFMEFVKGKTLHALIHESGNVLSYSIIRKFSKDLFDCMGYLMSKKVYHRDVKPANIMISDNGVNQQLKLVDFNLAKAVDSLDMKIHSVQGTPKYMAPELNKRPSRYNIKADLWSCGVVVIEMLTASKFEFSHMTAANFRRVLTVHQLCTTAMLQLIDSCVRDDPRKRKQPKDILGLTYFTHREEEHNMNYPSIESIEKCGPYKINLLFNTENLGLRNIEKVVIAVSLSGGLPKRFSFSSNDLKHKPLELCIERPGRYRFDGCIEFRSSSTCRSPLYFNCDQEFDFQQTPEEATKLEIIENNSVLIPTSIGFPDVHQLRMQVVFCDENKMIRKLEFGAPQDTCDHKVILLVGQTGKGKSTTLNSMVSYLFGVQYEDPFRFAVVSPEDQNRPSQSQTDFVTAYTFYPNSGIKLPYTITIVDTPGFGSADGFCRDESIVESIREFLTSSGLDFLNAVCFVVDNGCSRLTPTQKYIFHSVFSNLGKNLKDAVKFLITFADAAISPAEATISAAFPFLPANACFKLNNSAVFSKLSGEKCCAFTSQFWKIAMKTMDELFQYLGTTEKKDLAQTCEVIKHQRELMSCLKEVDKEYNKGLEILSQCKKLVQEYERWTQEAMHTRPGTAEFCETKLRVQILSDPSLEALNCLICRKTCRLLQSQSTVGVATSRNPCDYCHCDMDQHGLMNKQYTRVTSTVQLSPESQELKEKHHRAMDRADVSKTNVIDGLRNSFYPQCDLTKIHVQEVVELVHKLEQTVLYPEGFAEVDYIDSLLMDCVTEERNHARLSQMKTIFTLMQNIGTKHQAAVSLFDDHFQVIKEKYPNFPWNEV